MHVVTTPNNSKVVSKTKQQKHILIYLDCWQSFSAVFILHCAWNNIWTRFRMFRARTFLLLLVMVTMWQGRRQIWLFSRNWEVWHHSRRAARLTRCEHGWGRRHAQQRHVGGLLWRLWRWVLLLQHRGCGWELKERILEWVLWRKEWRSTCTPYQVSVQLLQVCWMNQGWTECTWNCIEKLIVNIIISENDRKENMISM